MKDEYEIKVTIIVPVYNAEKTIVPCAGNLVNQSLRGIEIIFIDDCSQDQSFEILQEINKQFPQIVKVIQTDTNSGPGGARNKGLECAQGKYIGFVDSDDLVDVSMYEKLYYEAEKKHLDILDCSFISEQKNSIIMPIPDELTGELDMEKRNILISKEGYIWSKLFRRDFLEHHRMRFRENVAMEDTDFILMAYAVAGAIGSIKDTLYKHTLNKESIMEKMTAKNNYNTVFLAMEAIYSRLSGLSFYEDIRLGCEAMLINLYLCGIVNCLNAGCKKSETIQMLTSLRNMKKGIVCGGYNNPFISKDLNMQCMNIMKTNDKKPEELVK